MTIDEFVARAGEGEVGVVISQETNALLGEHAVGFMSDAQNIGIGDQVGFLVPDEVADALLQWGDTYDEAITTLLTRQAHKPS